MTENTILDSAENGDGWHAHRWRIAVWSAAVLILLLPLVAMQFTDNVAWGIADFAVAAILLLGTGLAFEVVARTTGHTAYRAGGGVALAAALLLVWTNLAVGLIGSEDNAANLMYVGVLAVGVVGAVIARFQPRGMALALFATALAQALVAVIALVAGLGGTSSGPAEVLLVNGIFVALFAGSALLFRQAETAQDAGTKLRVHAILSAIVTVIGLMIMTFMILVESEPGAVPLLLVVSGIGWFLITRYRMRRQHK